MLSLSITNVLLIGVLYPRNESLVELSYDDLNTYNSLSEWYNVYDCIILIFIIGLSLDGVPTIGRTMSNPELNGAFGAKYW
jgi:hypothetical protein